MEVLVGGRVVVNEPGREADGGVDHADMVGERVGLLQVPGSQQHSDAAASQGPDHPPHALGVPHHVETAGHRAASAVVVPGLLIRPSAWNA